MGFWERIFGGQAGRSDASGSTASDLPVAVAALLLHIGMADFELLTEERERASALLADYFDFPAERVSEIMAEASRQLREQTGMYVFTERINRALPREERIPIMEMVWAVIFTDRRLEGNEDQVAHGISRLLGLDHSQMIAAKMKVRNELDKRGGGAGR
ncbi:MAG: TerB family tellurite resistance protein [candidate division Zixibacteria bacterium]|nr:TerB family tellurite resistance protein [candidate division Zixibacteria bacterium]